MDISNFNTSTFDNNVLKKSLMEYPRHEIELAYADIIKTIYITVFYAPVCPIGLFLSLIGFMFQYWVEKYTILRRKHIRRSLSVNLSLEMTEYLDYII